MTRLVGINHVALEQDGVAMARSGSLDFRGPWGNNVQIVDCRGKTEAAQREIRERGLAEGDS
jgi:hypothetical protein